MQKIKILPRREILKLSIIGNKIFDNEASLISISTTEKEMTECQNWKLKEIGFTKCLFLFFADCDNKVDKEILDKNETCLFNEKYAKQIIDFLFEIEKMKNLIVHCSAGISRSGAVGLFANDFYKLDYFKFKNDNVGIIPNNYIYWELMKFVNSRGVYEILFITR